MKRALAYMTVISLMTGVFYLTKPSIALFVIAGALNLALIFVISKKDARTGTVIGTWEKWTVRYKPDADDKLSAHFNQVTRTITVDDEWEGLMLDERHAVLAHEAGHASDKTAAAMNISTMLLLAVGRAAMLAFVLRDGVTNAVVMIGVSLAVCVAVMFITALLTKKVVTFKLKTVIIPAAAVLCGWQLAAASALMVAAKMVALVISRESEYVADRYAKRTGHAVSLARVLSRLKDGGAIPSIFRTHPTNAQRIGNLVR